MPTATEMKVTRTDLNPCTIQLEVACTADQVRAGFDKAYKGFAKQLRVPGFRPGTAPKSMVDKLVPEADIANSAAEEIVKVAMRDALANEKIQPHDWPTVNVTKLEKEAQVLEFTAKVPLKPIVELGEYKGLAVERPKVSIEDSEVESYLEDLRKRQGKREAITDRGAVEGDVAVVSLSADDTEDRGRNFMTVVGQTFPALDKALLGMSSEEMKVETLDFPADFQDKQFAGKKAKVRIAVKSLSSMTAADLDDEFAKNIDMKSLKSENVEELKAKLKQRLLEIKQQMSQEYVNEALQEALVEASKIEVPDTMWESVATRRLQELAEESARNGSNLEEYAKQNGMTVESMVANWQAEAKVQVKRAVAAREIFAQERMKLTNEDLNQMLVQMAYEYEIPPQQLAEIMQKNKNFQELEIRAVFKKVMDFLNMHAAITEVDTPGGGEKKPKAAKAKAEPKAEATAEETEKPKKTTKKKAD